ncbi:unnamed protein product [Rotaria sordida]|uniref:Phosphatidylinositol 3,4,5-trisphosphate 3-phosphatase and dual-specificity protein phosphatase PTEN n=1 Tax=Rotaria sordida TaxID=392033 RepID=A0A818M6K5_9BILA|nr:unnamed protein product [Rotaria sordida]CAF3585348.1 unnamed protein product [Rotaria sordida]
MITNPMNRMRQIVSKKKRRYQQDGFDLDLTYIRPNVIAMGYPADSYEGVYRNNIGDVSRFLSSKHGDKFYIYNLCVESERQYDGSRFHNQVCSDFSFEDHNPPTIKMILGFCQHAETQLKETPDRTLVIHCKAGKGRTGVMSCCLLLYYYRQEHNDPLQTLKFYAQQRTSNGKGVTIPSQRRYVEYFGHLLNSRIMYIPKQILFTGLLITYEQNQVLHSSLSYTVKSADHRIQYQSFEIPLERDPTIRRDLPPNYSVLDAAHKHFIPPSNQQCRIPLEEDVLIEIFVTKTKRGRPEKLCHFWFNTFFLVEPKMQTILSNVSEKQSESKLGTLGSCLIPECGHKHLYTMTKTDIDGLHKDKLHRLAPSSFTISVLFDYIPTSSSSLPTMPIQSCTLSEKQPHVNLPLIESNNNSTFIIDSSDKLIDKNQLKQNNGTNDKLNKTNMDTNNKNRRNNQSISSNRRAFALYPNCLSDWDSTDSETSTNETNPNDESDICQTHS